MEKTNQIDYTCALSIDILRIIVSFLPATDQACASLLSNSWKSACDSLENRDFDERLFKQHVGKSHSDLFSKFVEVSIQKIHTQRVNLESFRLHMYHDFSGTGPICRWIELLPKKCLKVLELSFDSESRYDIYRFPLSTLSSLVGLNSLKSLTLSRFNIFEESELGDEMEFGYLKELCLTYVEIYGSTLHKIIDHCQMISVLTIINCHRIENLRISSLPCLLSVTIVNGRQYHNINDKVEINSSTLQNFYYEGSLKNIVDLTCPNLSDLTLRAKYAGHDEELIESFILKFPLLNTLVLDFALGMREIRISNPSIKTLKIRQVFDLRKAHIHAPNLEGLEISLSLKDKLHMRSSILTDASKLQKIELELNNSRQFDTYWLIELRNFLNQFAQKVILNLELQYPQVKWNYGEIQNIDALPPVAIEHLNLNISKQIPHNYGEFLEEFFRSCHPKSLSLRFSKILTTQENYMKTLCELIEIVNNPILNCCNASQIKCWRHYLKSYEITQANDGKIIDCKDFLKRANQFGADKVGSSKSMPSGNTDQFWNIKIDFHFLWIIS